MKVDTAWVKPPNLIGGLDHLGSQAPCVLIYSQLLPGITNVTDRARYYSFYPWLIWSLEHRLPSDTDEATFIERFRRADCLFTLIAERHAQCTDQDDERHGTGMVGRQKLVSAVQRLKGGDVLKLSTFTHSESDRRYFKNRMGGLGQYYAGTLADLNVLDGQKKPWYRYTTEVGRPLAEAFDRSVPSDEFWDVVERGEVDQKKLDLLHAFCPCALRAPNSDEHKQLLDIYFDRKRAYESEGTQRRHSLALIQQLARSLPQDCELNEFVFRAAAYTASLPGTASL